MRRVTATVIVALAAGVLAGAVLASGLDWSEQAAADLDAALLEAPSFKLADIPAVDGKPVRAVMGQLTSTGHFCLWDAPSVDSPDRGGGCNPADDPLGGRPMSVSLAYDGGPAAASVSDARIIGLAEPVVAAVQVLMTDGSLRKVALKRGRVGEKEYGVFGYRIRKSDLRKALGPSAVIALDSDGKEIYRETTGFAG
jgi:hypothetical protein